MKPTFIIGYKRSGTTLLRIILDSHKDIFCPTETYLLKHFCNILRDERCMIACKKINKDFIDYLRHSVFDFYRETTHRHKKKFWAEKSTENIDYVDEIYRLFDDDCNFIYMVRHPLDVCYSVKQLHPDKPCTDILNDWKEKNKKILSFKNNHPSDVYLVKYEELCHMPSAVINELCGFLDIQVDKKMWHPYQVKHDFLFDDPKIQNYDRIKENTGNYQNWSRDKVNRLYQVVYGLSEEFGYEV